MSCADPGGRQGVQPPPLTEKSQIYRVCYNTGQDPLNNYKAIKPAFNVGPSLERQRNAI